MPVKFSFLKYKPWLLTLFIVSIIAACQQKPKVADNSGTAWYKQQVIYNLDIKVFKDSDDDGIGDLNGLTSKLAYLENLGVTTIWLAPFQPSPGKDDGYDVADYYAIDNRLGTEDDLNLFLQEAHRRKMRVIMDVVLNHSSNEHPWFKRAAQDSASAKHDWYLWSKERPKDWDKGMGFPDVETATWTKNEKADSYYFHRFYHFEPDLNYQNADVIREAEKILAYWMDKGLDGFRLDAVPFVIDDPRKSSEHPDTDLNILHRLAKFVKNKRPDALLLGEANIDAKENQNYFAKDKDGLDMMFNFEVNEYLFYAMASGNTRPLQKALQITSEKPSGTQWAQFLRNHDEVDLGKLSKSQRNEVYQAMGPDTSMQVYQRGIRRRLAPMLNNDMKRLKMAYALLFALPGTPVIRYGEEIGMGDDLSLKERLAVRTPMQWDTTFNSGFSKSGTPLRPVISAGVNGYPVINVASELRADTSLLNFTKKLIRLRKQHPEIGAGQWKLIETGSDHLLAILYDGKKDKQLLVINFSSSKETARINTSLNKNQGLNIFTSHKDAVTIKGTDSIIDLTPYDFKWYTIQ